MTLPDVDGLYEILTQLNNTPGVLGWAIVERDGLVRLHKLPEWINPETIGEIVKDVVKTCASGFGELLQGELASALIDCRNGRLFFVAIGDKVLAIIASYNAKLGILLLKLRMLIEVWGKLGYFFKKART
jgi:predicted regulator of Ras-like GTPase activity (Roadblock/LC7/MglB family)